MLKKDKIVYLCTNCGYKISKWMGKCPECMEWNSFEEEVNTKIKKIDKEKIKVFNFNDVKITENYRYKTSLNEFDRVLGGGLVTGSVALITGNPGVGKSTLLLQASQEYSKYGKVLYISGEESVDQIKHRGARISINSNNLFIMVETQIELIYDYILKDKLKVVIIDSIQTLYSSEFNSLPGTITQIRECTLKIIDLAKGHGVSFFLVGHITKDGKVAGPKLLEHMVDTVLNFEGEGNHLYRILRSLKNRFGSTNEIGIFNMDETGISEVKNPSEFFLSARDEKNIGSIVAPMLEGSKIFLLEIQTLTIPTVFGIPRRVVQGLDYNRLQIITAILEKKLGFNLSSQDIYINVPGGITIKETSADLAIAMSIISVVKNKFINKKIAALGELGLRGEVRKISFLDKRIKELEKLGFMGVYLPEGNKKDVESSNYEIKIIYLKNLDELVERMG